MYIGVLVELSNKNIDKKFIYSVPPQFEKRIKLGIRVEVPFGHQTLEGFIVSFEPKPEMETKNILSIIDEDVIINQELLELGKIMQAETLSTLISCYQVMLPKALKAKKGTLIKKKYETFYRLAYKPEKFSKKQYEIIKLFETQDEVSGEILKEISPSSLKTLTEKGVLTKVQKEKYRHIELEEKEEKKPLTEEQQNVVIEFENSTDQVYLLHGVTGSGKTEVYMELIEHCLNRGQKAIVLVPEISLTPQTISRFSKRFGSQIALLHSALSDGERYDEWRRINRNEVDIVIGARSALFAPLQKLGLIVIDEEHSDSYKQDDSNPRYDAISMAIKRAQLNKNCKVILGSATPSLDSYARALKKVYHLLSLPNRINKKGLPTVTLIDMNQEFKKSKGHFSPSLLEKIIETLHRNEQVILLLNRRGYANFVTCKNCGYTIKCPHCDITLTYHKTSNNLRCHYCGYATNKVTICPECHEEALSDLGTGTEKVEEELKQLIPEAKILRMDFDTTSKKGSHQKMIEQFKTQKFNILLGTQIVAKGLDFANVTLVGVINADTSLNIPNFRSSEATFSLLSQVAGRSGRGSKTGEVIIQTYNPNHYAIKYVQKHDYQSFFKKEMMMRKELNYPPYYYIAYIRISGKDDKLCYKESLKIQKLLKKYLNMTTILGPSPCNIYKLNNVYRYGIILKYKKEDNLKKLLNKIIDVYKSNKLIVIDLNFNPIVFG